MAAYILRRLLLIIPTLLGIMLLNFAIVNASLVRIKLKTRGQPAEDFKVYPIWIPILGGALCLLFLTLQLFTLSA